MGLSKYDPRGFLCTHDVYDFHHTTGLELVLHQNAYVKRTPVLRTTNITSADSLPSNNISYII
jgi:hypothetical protein